VWLVCACSAVAQELQAPTRLCSQQSQSRKTNGHISTIAGPLQGKHQHPLHATGSPPPPLAVPAGSCTHKTCCGRPALHPAPWFMMYSRSAANSRGLSVWHTAPRPMMPYLPRRAPLLPSHAHTAPGGHLSMTWSMSSQPVVQSAAGAAVQGQAFHQERGAPGLQVACCVPRQGAHAVALPVGAHAVSQHAARGALAASCAPRSARAPHSIGNTHAEPSPRDSRPVTLSFSSHVPKSAAAFQPSRAVCNQCASLPTHVMDITSKTSV